MSHDIGTPWRGVGGAEGRGGMRDFDNQSKKQKHVRGLGDRRNGLGGREAGDYTKINTNTASFKRPNVSKNRREGKGRERKEERVEE